MRSVLVQVWMEKTMFGGYDWITAGVIENPETLDADYLRDKAMAIINKRDYKPFTNAVRLIVKGDKTEMKMTITDLW